MSTDVLMILCVAAGAGTWFLVRRKFSESKATWLSIGAAFCALVAAIAFVDIDTDADCIVDWDGRSNPTVCD